MHPRRKKLEPAAVTAMMPPIATSLCVVTATTCLFLTPTLPLNPCQKRSRFRLLALVHLAFCNTTQEFNQFDKITEAQHDRDIGYAHDVMIPRRLAAPRNSLNLC